MLGLVAAWRWDLLPPGAVEGYHSVVTLFVPFFKLGSDSKFDSSKDFS